ncbi:hypothetical protein K4L06_19215 [Lysobacter sp. BMK333-48F3]|uniref:hypothetical protein n=1 Tax=Lysobacter sp. BMK333-48F3 TaxID=2867962 RepID=UPI001C8B5401|nr:hypothetical protein [Lysobacter sp. BMK333-48F3]MBX9403449.1 hypothetical protein [Lysobacter sp. BMK333-48F3]
MNRGARMLLQLFAPPVVVAAGGVASGALLLQAAAAPEAAAFAPIARGLQAAALAVGAAMALHSLWRVWRWERGLEPQCPCGGLLSRPSSLQRGRARRCLGCRRPQPPAQPRSFDPPVRSADPDPSIRPSQAPIIGLDPMLTAAAIHCTVTPPPEAAPLRPQRPSPPAENGLRKLGAGSARTRTVRAGDASEAFDEPAYAVAAEPH